MTSRYYSRRVAFGPNDEEEEKMNRVLAAAANLQTYYEDHHNLKDNIPSDESGEPPAKVARCSTSTQSAESAHSAESTPSESNPLE